VLGVTLTAQTFGVPAPSQASLIAIKEHYYEAVTGMVPFWIETLAPALNGRYIEYRFWLQGEERPAQPTLRVQSAAGFPYDPDNMRPILGAQRDGRTARQEDAEILAFEVEGNLYKLQDVGGGGGLIRTLGCR